MKRRFKQLHLVLALIAGLFILNASISGSLLVFGKELQQLLQPDRWTISSGSKPVDVVAVVKRISQATQEQGLKIEQIRIEEKSDRPWVITLSNAVQWNFNPYTEEVIHRYPKDQDFYHKILSWHRWLLMEDSSTKPWARHITSSAALVLIIEIVLGYLLWFNPKKTRRKHQPPSKKNWRHRIRQLHTTVGVNSGIVLILVAFTGLSFHWSTAPLYEAATFSTLQARPKLKPVTKGGLNQLDVALQQAGNDLPHAALRRIHFPKHSGEPLLLRMQYPNESAPFSYVWVDGGSGQVLGMQDSAESNRANRLWNFKYAFHIGDFGGAFTKALWLLLALLPGLFTVSGLWLFWKKTFRSGTESPRISRRLTFLRALANEQTT